MSVFDFIYLFKKMGKIVVDKADFIFSGAQCLRGPA